MIKRLQGSFLIVVFFSLFLLVGCYHATIDTGLAPGSKTVEMWKHSWIAGLVPPSVVEAQSACENGVARVETQQSFVNGLVGILTYGIYTPMTVIVTCAADDMSSAAVDSASVVTVPYGSDDEEIMDAFGQAADKAVAAEQPAYVQFEDRAQAFPDSNETASKKKEEAVVDSAALYQTLDRMVHKAERLISLAQAALDDNRLHEAESLTDSIEGYLKGITDNPANTHPKNLRLRDLVFMGVKIGTDAMLRIEEAEWDSMGFFRYEKGTVERAAEVRAIRWVFGAGPVNDWRSEPVVEYSFLKGGRKFRIVKNISVENGRLTINMHTAPYDIVKRAYSAGSVSFSHPLKLMRDFRLLCYNLWSTHPSEWSVKRFRGIKEIELIVYYPGGQSGTETPIARFGIGRKALEGANWGDIRTKDGTFQDLMKKKGTYWLHSEVPDMGTPAHLVR